MYSMCTNHNHKSDLISDAMTDVNLAVEDANSKLLDVDGVTEESVDSDNLATSSQVRQQLANNFSIFIYSLQYSNP